LIISLFIAATKTCPISLAISKSRDIASRASTSIAREGSSISLLCCLPRCRIVMANLAEGATRAAGCDTSFCCRRCVMPSKPGVGTVLLLTSAVCREPLDKLIRRKLMPSLEHVTWREPTVTPSRLAISSRLIPCATNFLIFSITCAVNLTRLPLAGGLACGIIMAAPRSRPAISSSPGGCHAYALFRTQGAKLRQLPVILLSNVAYWQQTSSARRQNIGGYGTGANQGGAVTLAGVGRSMT
jgi:hypothetical protein